MPNVNCSVSSCKHHGSGDICTAKSIEVKDSSSQAMSHSDMEIGDIGSAGGPSGCSAETMCKTFKPS